MIISTCHGVPRVLLALGLALIASPAPVWACTIVAPGPSLEGQPADGAMDVPTDVVLVFRTPNAPRPVDDLESIPGEYTLRTDSGAAVELKPLVSLGRGAYFELAPTASLAPATRYTLEARWTYPDGSQTNDKLTFETGTGPLAAAAEPARALMLSYQLKYEGHESTCGPQESASCIAVDDDDAWYELVELRDGVATTPWLVQGSTMVYRPVDEPRDADRCVEVRRLLANGSRGQPLRLCAADSSLSDLSELDDELFLYCSVLGLQWCDFSGRNGIEPGVNGSPGDGSDLACASVLPPPGTQQSAQSVEDAGTLVIKGPEADGCSVAAPRARAPLSWQGLTAFAALGLSRLRRRQQRKRRPSARRGR
jgi:hypothetical protein